MSFYFLHIPKTAGSSVRDLLQRRFMDRLSPAFLLDHIVDRPPGYADFEAYCGHFGSDLGRFIDRDLVVTTVLRRPVARTVSHYLHVRRDIYHPYHRYLQSMSLKDFCDDPVTYPMVRNAQARYLATSLLNPMDWGLNVSPQERSRSWVAAFWEASTVAYDDEALLTSAQAGLNRCAFVGVTEAFDVYWRTLCDHLGVEGVEAARLNVADNDLAGEEIDDETLAAIQRHTRIDQLLYDAALGRLPGSS